MLRAKPPRSNAGRASPLANTSRHSDRQVLQKSWQKVHASLKKMRFDRSPFVPETLSQYVEHLSGIYTILQEEKVERSEQDVAPSDRSADVAALMAHLRPGPSSIEQVINPDCFRDRVIGLANVTIWAPTWQPSVHHPMAIWPPEQEFREEGDERHTSQFGRFLPIPRGPGGNNWKQRSFLTQFEMDRVRPVPKKVFGIQLPHDIEVLEPTMDENGVYVDDQSESGRETFGDTTGRCATRGVLARDGASPGLQFGSQTSMYNSGYQSTTPPLYSRNSPHPEIVTPLLVTPDLSKVFTSQTGKPKISYAANLLAQTADEVTAADQHVALALVEELLDSRRYNGTLSPTDDTFPHFTSENAAPNLRQKPSFNGPIQPSSRDVWNNGSTYGEKATHSAHAPRKSTLYGRNKFGMHETIYEESPEELMETVFGQRRASIWARPVSRGSVDADLTLGPMNASLVPRSESMSPLSPLSPPPNYVYGQRSYYGGPRSNSSARLEEDFGPPGRNY